MAATWEDKAGGTPWSQDYSNDNVTQVCASLKVRLSQKIEKKRKVDKTSGV